MRDKGRGMGQAGAGRKPARGLPIALMLLLGLILIAGGVIVVALTAGSGAAGTGVATSPELVVDRQEIDFGEVPVNQSVRAEFRLSNAGGKPLQIVGEPQVEVVKGC